MKLVEKGEKGPAVIFLLIPAKGSESPIALGLQLFFQHWISYDLPRFLTQSSLGLRN